VLPDNLGYLLDSALAPTPSKPAVYQVETVLTYAELDARANRMADALGSQHPNLRDACVVPAPPDVKGEVLVAFVVAREAGVTSEDDRGALKARAGEVEA
jgi:acyl-CoA synthetase (AMP-forming)/AMP-acid ligase II